MLRNVLADYLSSLRNEREFDAPFMALLAAMAFYDIHFTHGQAEFGKDFIAKRLEGQDLIQYVFQSKCGDISQGEWRNNIMGQVLECVTNTLSHPHLDATLPQQLVLVTTGRLSNNAALGMQNLNNDTLVNMKKRPVIAWEQPQLIDFLATYGPEGIHRATAAGYANYGEFYSLYGQAMQRQLTTRRIEFYSRNWLQEPTVNNKRMLIAVIEAETIAAKCKENGALYEALHMYLCAVRAVEDAIFTTQADNEQNTWLLSLYAQMISVIRAVSEQYLSSIRQHWTSTNRGLLALINGSASMVCYPVHCSRIMEVAGLLYFLTEDQNARSDVGSFLNEFVSTEPGCSHFISDYYAVSLSIAVLALKHAGAIETAQILLHQTTVWVCDRYQEGFGLASMEDTPYEEVALLLGYPFESVDTQKRTPSFLATTLCDLAAFVGNTQLYADIVNDFLASDIVFPYWQVRDTRGQFLIEGNDVIQYPNIEFADALSTGTWEYAEHIRHELRSFAILDRISATGYAILALVLRDRYFPTIWPVLTA